MKPLIRPGGLSHSWWLLTRYTVKGDAIVASTKYDITDQIDAIVASLTAERDALADQAYELRRALESAWAHHGVSHRAVGSACVGTDRETVAALAFDEDATTARALLRPSEPVERNER